MPMLIGHALIAVIRVITGRGLPRSVRSPIAALAQSFAVMRWLSLAAGSGESWEETSRPSATSSRSSHFDTVAAQRRGVLRFQGGLPEAGGCRYLR